MDLLHRITLDDPVYPPLLTGISDPPETLWVAGALPEKTEKLMAVVGTRKPTAYGVEAARYLTRELVRAGFGIVSGMALGVDAIAHETALAEHGRTYAVLGCGADIVYPAEHKKLYTRIAGGGGGVISEYEPGTPPMPFRFPERNRIIAGLSLGTLVVEAKEKSGARITGRLALEENREVFAVPGPITSPSSKGCHALIKEGAKLVEDVNDILAEFGFEAVGVQERLLENVSDTERVLVTLLAEESRRVDDLVRASRMSAQDVHATLTVLEIKGLAQHLGGGIYGAVR